MGGLHGKAPLATAVLWISEAGPGYGAQVGFGLTIRVPQPPECWDYRPASPSPALFLASHVTSSKSLNFSLTQRPTYRVNSVVVSVCTSKTQSQGLWFLVFYMFVFLGQGLSSETGLASNLEESSSLCLPSTEITGLHYHDLKTHKQKERSLWLEVTK